MLQVLLFFLIEKKEPFDTLLVQPTTRVHPYNNKAFNFIDLFFCFFPSTQPFARRAATPSTAVVTNRVNAGTNI